MTIKSIAIEVTDKAFLPESFAYRNYLIENGFECTFIKKGDKRVIDYDAVLLFHGLHPFWKKYPKFIIGEYHSLSTGKYSRFKDVIKKIINVRADLYIFLNENVRKKLWFGQEVNYITREMGVSISKYRELTFKNKEFDLVYSGSYRNGLKEQLLRLANLGFSIALVGPEFPIKHSGIKNFGRQSPKVAREIIACARYGLNYTPDVFPLNIQDSTKVIEYCAAGLGVITNRYEWVNRFEASVSGKFLTLSDINTKKDVEEFTFIRPKIEHLDWRSILSRSGFLQKVKGLK
jgi:hypothetical protein